MLNKRKSVNNSGHRSLLAFTLIELILVIAIMAVLTSIVTIRLSNLVPRANLNTTAEILLAEIRLQQLRAMNREKDENQQSSEYGIYVEQQRYVLFSGSSYDENDSDNLITEVSPPLELNSTFPNQTIIFAQGSGEILNFADDQNAVSITDTISNQINTFNFNSYGVPE